MYNLQIFKPRMCTNIIRGSFWQKKKKIIIFCKQEPSLIFDGGGGGGGWSTSQGKSIKGCQLSVLEFFGGYFNLA